MVAMADNIANIVNDIGSVYAVADVIQRNARPRSPSFLRAALSQFLLVISEPFCMSLDR